MSTSPLRAFLDLKRRELPLTLLMFGYFFLVITTFWILKPIKKGAFFEFYDGRALELFGAALDAAQAELIAKVLNMGVAFAAVVAFSALARTLRRQQLTYVFAAFSVLSLALFSVSSPRGELAVWLFYLFGDLFNTLMVATFFAFLNDSFTPAEARRTYGPIVLGGVAGGAFGSLFVNAQIAALPIQTAWSTWAWIAAAGAAAVALLAALAGREVARRLATEPRARAPVEPVEAVAPRANPALDGARLVARSRYLLAIVVMVGVYELVSTIVDFQLSRTIVALSAPDEISANFSLAYLITNVTALVVQIFLTGFVLGRFGVSSALLIMPVAVLAASVGFMVMPIIAMGILMSSSDNGLSYSINQSAREALYTVTGRAEKYQAKAFIDMFVQRAAKAVAVGVSLLVTLLFEDVASTRWLSIVVILGVVLWLLAARYAGREFRARADRPPAEEVSP